MREIIYLVVHCTAGSQKETNAQLIKGFRARGWKNNGYHYVIDADGTVHNITNVEQIANGVAGHNSKSIHISYKGGVDTKTGKAVDNRTDAQKEALITLLKQLRLKYPKAKIKGHRDFSPDTNKNGKVDKWEWVKVCPCFDAMVEYKDI